jgi:hypothetical protein
MIPTEIVASINKSESLFRRRHLELTRREPRGMFPTDAPVTHPCFRLRVPNVQVEFDRPLYIITCFSANSEKEYSCIHEERFVHNNGRELTQVTLSNVKLTIVELERKSQNRI